VSATVCFKDSLLFTCRSENAIHACSISESVSHVLDLIGIVCCEEWPPLPPPIDYKEKNWMKTTVTKWKLVQVWLCLYSIRTGMFAYHLSQRRYKRRISPQTTAPQLQQRLTGRAYKLWGCSLHSWHSVWDTETQPETKQNGREHK
jgi:hypothetical protein